MRLKPKVEAVIVPCIEAPFLMIVGILDSLKPFSNVIESGIPVTDLILIRVVSQQVSFAIIKLSESISSKVKGRIVKGIRVGFSTFIFTKYCAWGEIISISPGVCT